MSKRIIVDRRLYLDGDGELVEQGDRSAVRLWAGEGREVSSAEAEAVGYQPTEVDEPDADATVDEPEDIEPDDTPDEPEPVDEPADDGMCGGTTAAGNPCSNTAGDNGFCHLHRE